MEIALFEPAKLYRFEHLLGASDVLLGCLLGASWKLGHPHDALLISMDFIRFHQISFDFHSFSQISFETKPNTNYFKI